MGATMKTCLGFLSGFVFLVALVGCGGGGGAGTGGGPLTLVNWLSVSPPEAVEADGLSQYADYNTGVEPIYVENDPIASSAIITFDADSNIEEIEIETPVQILRWTVDGDIIRDESKWVYAIDGDQSNIAIASNPMHVDSNPAHAGVGWQYQTFGTWMTGRQLEPVGFSGTGRLGGISVGVSASAVPTTDGVTFRGNTSGLYIDSSGDDYFVWSTIDFIANFAEAPFQLVISDQSTPQRTPVAELLDGVPSLGEAAPELVMSGTLTYDPNTQLFSGVVLTDDRLSLSGTSTGQFYGPTAEELGGVFRLSTADTESLIHYSGAYGAADIAKPPVP